MLVLVGFVSRTIGVSVVGSAKRTNSPTVGSGLAFLVDGLVAPARTAGMLASIARRVMLMSPVKEMLRENRPLR